MRHSIKIMHIVLSLDCGGLERLAVDLSCRFNNKKYQSFICCLDSKGELSIRAEKEEIRVIRVGRRPGFDISLPLRIRKILKKEKIDIVHTHNLGALLYGTLGAKLAQVPVIINTRHGRAKGRINRLIWRMNDSVIAISEDAKNELLKNNQISPDKIKVIYNGIEINRFKNNTQSERNILSINNTDLVIGTISRLSKEKDQFSLLDAFLKVSRVLNNTKLIFIGDGNLREQLEDYSRTKRIAEKVKFLGFREDIAKLLNIFDVFALSSLTEGICLSLLEAMAAGKPVVATDVGGNPEVVVDGVTGFVVPSKSPDKMAEAVIRILQNPEMASGMGDAGRKRVEEKFNLDRMVREYEELYNHCLNKKRDSFRLLKFKKRDEK